MCGAREAVGLDRCTGEDDDETDDRRADDDQSSDDQFGDGQFDDGQFDDGFGDPPNPDCGTTGAVAGFNGNYHRRSSGPG